MKHLVIAGLLLLWSITADAEWLTLPAMTETRIEAMSAVDQNGAVYLIGGSDRHETSAAVARFGEDGKWQALAAMPYSLAQGAAVCLDGKIYVAGGFDGRILRPELLIYDIAADAWAVGPATPEGRFGYRLDALDGKLYLTGGGTLLYQSVGDNCWRYDPASGVWEVLAPMAVARKHHGSAILDDRLIVFGGVTVASDERLTLTTAESYNPASDSWASIEAMPVAFSNGASGTVEGSAWACGGLQDGTVSAACYNYQAAADAWTAGEDAPFNSYRLGAGGGSMVLAGGEMVDIRGWQPVMKVAIQRETSDDDDNDNDNDNDDDNDNDNDNDDYTDDDDDASPDEDDDETGDGDNDDDDDDDDCCGC